MIANTEIATVCNHIGVIDEPAKPAAPPLFLQCDLKTAGVLVIIGKSLLIVYNMIEAHKAHPARLLTDILVISSHADQEHIGYIVLIA